MKFLLTILLALLACACSKRTMPERWRAIPFPQEKLAKIEDSTNEHGLYLEYKGLPREELLRQAETALVKAGYAKVGVALEDSVLGFAKGDDKLAVKVDQFGESLFLAVFDEQGKDPLLHGVVFGKYSLGESESGPEAAEHLRKELESAPDR